MVTRSSESPITTRPRRVTLSPIRRGEQVFQSLQAERLREMALETGFRSPLRVLGQCVAGQGDEEHISQCRVGAESARDLVAVHPR